MEFNIEIRKKQLENLDQFISSTKDRVHSILDYLGWSAENVAENKKETIKCPLNQNHRMPKTTLNKHLLKCCLQREMYDQNDLPLSEPNPIPGSTIIIDDLTKVNVLNSALASNPQMKTGWQSSGPEPNTSNRLLTTFTSDERLALYEYTLKATKGPPTVPEFNVEPKIVKKHNLTAHELKIIERDAKRRRIKYRTKSIHTNNKSSTEILREIIDGQMELYEDWLHNKREETVSGDDTIHEEIKMKNNFEEKVNSQDEKLESPVEPTSPRSSKSQNSFKSQESRHKYRRSRSRSHDRSRDRSSSRSTKYDYRRNSRNDYSSRRRRDNRSFDRDRKYESRRHYSRESSRNHRDTSQSKSNRS